MENKEKFSKFVSNIEQKMLDGNQESMVLQGTNMNEYIGGTNHCQNNASSCDGSTNKNCTNKSKTGCKNSSNKQTLFGGGCSNSELQAVRNDGL